MKRHLNRSLPGWALMLALIQAGSAWATDFAIRQVTNFATSSNTGPISLLGVVNDRMIFQGGVGGERGLYRTDGTTTELISSAASIASSDVAVVNNQIFFAATGPNGKELYSTDGQTL